MQRATAPFSPRTCAGPRWAAATAASCTFVAAVVLDVLAGASLWHIATLGALSGAVGLMRVHRFGRRHRVTSAVASGVLVAQPALHLAGEISHRSVNELQPGQGVVHAGLLVVQVVLAIVTALVVAVSDVLLLAVAGVLRRVAWLVVACGRATPATPPRRSTPTEPEIAGQLFPWVAYAARRGPPSASVHA